jgi:very-short-patch-repair endonuclease
VERDLLALAGRQHGLVTARQALDAGLSHTQMHDRIASGHWKPVWRGVHHFIGSPFTWHTKVMAACLATGGVASHRTASVLHGVVDARKGRPEITVVRNRRVRLDGITVHESTDLCPAHIRRIGGIPTTTPVRLAMDLGSVVPFPTYERAMDDLIARKLLAWEGMLDLLCRLSRRGRNGLAAARALLAERYGDSVPESVLERAFLALVLSADLPEPQQQVVIADDDGFIARVDFAFVEPKVAVELDSRRYHLHADAFEQDRSKRNRLQLLGWQVLAYTADHLIRTGPTVVRELRRAVTR